MKILNASHLCPVGALMLGLIVAWNTTCFAQKVDVGMKVGACLTCHHIDGCDMHAVMCTAQPNKTCLHSPDCCRGPGQGSGSCTVFSRYTCKWTGCNWRRDEICN